MSSKQAGEAERNLPGGIELVSVPASTLPPAISTNSYLIGRRELAAVDPAEFIGAGQGPLLERLTGRLSRKVITILLTHAHPDHCGAAARLASMFDAKIAGHRLELDKFARTCGSGLRLVPLDEGDRVEAGQLAIEVLHTPGHSRGHLCYYINSLGALFSGDTVLGFGTSIIRPPDGDMADYMRSLERLRSLPLRLILPGHGPILWEPAKKLDEYIEHRKMRERKILDAVKSGCDSPAKIARAIYGEEDMKVHGYDLLPRAELMVLAHLIKLEKEGAVARAASGNENSFIAKA